MDLFVEQRQNLKSGASKRTYANSRGNTHLLPQQQSHSQASKTRVPESFADSDAESVLNLLLVKCDKECCILKHFSDASRKKTDYNGAIQLLQTCYSIVCNKDDDELFAYLTEQYRMCRAGVLSTSSGKSRNDMKYMLGLNREVPVCKKCFAKAYFSTVTDLETISLNMKLSPTERINTSRIRAFEDATILPFNYAAVDKIFEDNVGCYLDNRSTGKKTCL